MFPCRILIAEDDAASREMLAEFLKLQGHVVFAAADGEAAIRMAEAVCPDLVLTDICMPCLTGVELCRHLRNLPQTERAPILAMTALCADGWDEIQTAGFEDILPKPLELDELERRVVRACRL